MGKILNELKQTTAAQMYRHITTICIVVTPLWVFSGPFVKAYAADALLEVLIQQGLDPAVIKEMKQQGVENSKEVKEIGKDLDTVKQQIGQVSNQINQQSTQSDRLEILVRQLLEAQLRKADALP